MDKKKIMNLSRLCAVPAAFTVGAFLLWWFWGDGETIWFIALIVFILASQWGRYLKQKRVKPDDFKEASG